MNPTPSTAGGFFSQLAPLLAYRAVLITVSKLEEGDLLQVNICPWQFQQGENRTLTAPLCVTGTAAELAAELVSQLATFVSSHVGLTTNLAAIEQEVAEAADRRGIDFAEKEPVHSRELFGLCVRRRPQQLCSFRLPGQASILGLRA
jgi:PRTRC genetic system protein E